MSVIRKNIVWAAVFAAMVMGMAGNAAAQCEASLSVYVSSRAAPAAVNVSAAPLGGEVAATAVIARGGIATLNLAGGVQSVSHRVSRQHAHAAVRQSRGNIFVALDPQSYQNAIVSLHSVNGRRIMRVRAASGNAGGGVHASRDNVTAGVYVLSVKGAGGNTYSSKLTHGGGRLNISVAFGKSGNAALSKRAAGDCGEWIITASANGYKDKTYTRVIVPGDANEQLRIEADHLVVDPGTPIPDPPDEPEGDFVPEMLGLSPGANTSEVRFAWYSDDADDNTVSRIRLYGADGVLIEEFTGTNSAVTTGLVMPPYLNGTPIGKRSHKAAVNNLSPDTRYQYSVTVNGSDWSRKYGFKTPGSGAFRFAAVGDPQIDHETASSRESTLSAWKKTMTAIAGHGVDLIMSAGDHVDNGLEEEYKDFFAPPELRNIPFAPTMGNHDIILDLADFGRMYEAYLAHTFNLPNATLNMQSWWRYLSYWYLYNNVLFVSLNTGYFSIRTDEMNAASVKAEIDSLDKIIDNAKKAHAGKYDWLIVHHHRSSRSLGPHGARSKESADTMLMRYLEEVKFESIFDKHGADLVIAGHDHVYVRTLPIKDYKTVETGGTVYLTLLPAGSSKFYPLMLTPTPSWAVQTYPKSTSYNFSQKHGYTLFDVDGKNLSATVYDNEGGVVDVFVLTK